MPPTTRPPTGRRTPLPDRPRSRKGSDDPSPGQANPTGHRKSAQRITKSTPYLPINVTSKFKKLKPPSLDCSGTKNNGGGHLQQPGDGFVNDKAQANPGRKRQAGASVDNSFLEPGDPDPPCAAKRHSKKAKLPTKNTKLSKKNMKLSEDDVGELVQRAQGSSDAAIGGDTGGLVERNGAASVNQNVMGELGQHDVAVGETITVRREPQAPESLIGDSSGGKFTQAAGKESSGKEPEGSSIATGSSVPKV